MRTPEHRFIRWEDGHRELYDLVADPWQRRNLAERQPDVATAMEQRLDESLAASAAKGAAEREAAATTLPEPQSPVPGATPVATASPLA